MAATRRSNAGQKEQTPASLMDVLSTPTLRIELVAMVALISDTMRRDLLSVFEPSILEANAINDNLTTGGTLVDAGVKHENQVARRNEHTDLNSPQTQGLRRAVVTFFDKWQIDVLRRLGEVLNVRPEAIRKARADAKAKAQVAHEADKKKAFLDWAHGVDERDAVSHSQGDDADLLGPGFASNIALMAKDHRKLVLNSMLLLLLSLEHYSAHSRVLTVKLTRVLRLPESTLVEDEAKVADALLSSAASKMSADESTQKQASEGAAARRWKIGAATVAGAALIGITGGLAAPILAAGVGGLMGGLGLGAVATLLGPLATNMVLVGGLFGAYGGRMTGQIMEKYAAEIKDFKFLPISDEQRALGETDDSGIAQLRRDEVRQSHKLRIAIGISGSVTDASGFLEAWKVFSTSRIEAFGLRWEMDALTQLGRKISEVLRSYAWDFAKFQLLSLILSGLWPFGLLRAAGSLDSPFAIAKTRSDKAGKILADALVTRVQGSRPVTLVGFGLGARVIYSCLLQLADLNAFGLVESAVLIGAPTPSDAASWRRLRAVVSGRVVNCFSGDDFMLGFLYRASSAQIGIAGVQEIEGIVGVENFDLTELVKSHDDYPQLMGTILQRIGFEDLDHDAVRTQQAELQGKIENRQRPVQKEARDDELIRQEEMASLVDAEPSRSMSTTAAAEEKRPLERQLAVRPKQPAQRDSDENDHEPHNIRMEDKDDPLTTITPQPEPDYGPDRETVRFGADKRGFQVDWEYRHH